MVTKQLVSREPSSEDRRKITLSLTGSGQKILEEISEQSQKDLAQYLAPLTDEERAVVFSALELLEPLFSAQRDLEESSGSKVEKN